MSFACPPPPPLPPSPQPTHLPFSVIPFIQQLFPKPLEFFARISSWSVLASGHYSPCPCSPSRIRTSLLRRASFQIKVCSRVVCGFFFFFCFSISDVPVSFPRLLFPSLPGLLWSEMLACLRVAICYCLDSGIPGISLPWKYPPPDVSFIHHLQTRLLSAGCKALLTNVYLFLLLGWTRVIGTLGSGR